VDIRKLADLAAMPVRNVRYLITEGFVDHPDTKDGAVNAVYGERHLAQLRLYQTLRDAGCSQQEIRAMTAGRDPAEVARGLEAVVRHVLPGIEVRVVPALVPADVDRDELVQRILGALEVLGISKKGSEHADAQKQNRRSAGEAQGRRSRHRRGRG
jgi:DNA-binding transcriptional MerR regulator